METAQKQLGMRGVGGAGAPQGDWWCATFGGSSAVMDGLGSVTWWGLSPALNLEQQWKYHSCGEGLQLQKFIH